MTNGSKFIMISSSIALGLAGLFALFMPDVVASTPGGRNDDTIHLIIQIMGALYFGFAMMNWIAKDGIIGGIYARPVSYGNFVHFLTGALILLNYQFSHPFHRYAFTAMVLYAIFALLFYWLVFRSTGVKSSTNS
jgi:hypothetical protein